jgi:hypothetical protein
LKRVNYGNGKIDISIENCKTVGELKKKLCKCYRLGKDIIIVDNEKRILDENLILQMHPEEVWICLNGGGTLIDVTLSKIEYEIILNGSVHNFMAIVCNAWNHRPIEFYINCLIVGEQKKIEIYLDGILWTEQLLAMWKTRARITGIVGKNIKASSPECWIINKRDMEIWTINIKCGNFSKYLTIWSKVTLGYVLEIWKEIVNRFPDYD